MNRHVTSRIAAALLLGILCGLYVYYDQARWGRRGKDAFIAHEVHRFEATMAEPAPIAAAIFGVTVVVAGFLGVYEVIALGASALLGAKDQHGGSS